MFLWVKIMVKRVMAKFGETRFFKDYFNEKTIGQFKRYVITGILSFSLEYSIFTLLYKVLGLWYITSNTIAYIVIFCFNFILNRYWSFKSKVDLKKQLVMYGFLFLYNMLATNVLMYLFSDAVGISPQVSKVFVMGAVVSWNFIIYKKIIYR